MNSTQKIKLGSALSDCTNIVKDIPQGFKLDLLLFNIFMNDIFMILFLSRM